MSAIPTVASLVDWQVGLSDDGKPEVVIRLNDPAEARAWAGWLFDRCDDAVDAMSLSGPEP